MPEVVSISSLKGGVGKTSVTLGLASAALYRGLDVLVVDLDPHGDASTGLAVGTADSAGRDAAEVLSAPKKKAVERAAVPSGWTEPAGTGGRLDVVVGSSRSSAYEHLPSSRRNLGRLQEALARCSGYDLVLVDCPPALNSLTEIAWAASDKVLSVAEPSLFSVAGTERTMRAIARFEAGGDFRVRAASVVVNKVHPGRAEDEYRIEEMRSMFGQLLVSPVIPDAAVWPRIQGSAWPVHAWSGDEARELAEDFDRILAGLLGR